MIEKINSVDEIENLYKTGSHAPYDKLPKNNFGYMGVLLSLKTTGKIQCHLCGSWQNSLGQHVHSAHKIHAKEYKEKFGFTKNFPLCSEKVSSLRSGIAVKYNNNRGLKQYHKNLNLPKNRLKKEMFNKQKSIANKLAANSPAVLNKLDICDQQCVRRVKVLMEHLKKFPTWRQVQALDGGLQMVIRRRFGSWNKFKQQNFKDEPVFKSHGAQKYTNDYLLFVLRQFYLKNNRIPTTEDFRHLTPSTQSIKNRFGSWNRAKSLAGIISEEMKKMGGLK